jgi:signal transduction histidine kinase
LPKQLDDETEALLETAVQSAHQMESMVRDLLAYCKILHEEDEQCEVVESSEVLELALQNLATAIAEASGKITHDELPRVRMAKPHLLQVFQNLIGNALKHRAAEPPEIHIGVQSRGKYCEFSVVDNGLGIEPQFQERVFDVFKRLRKKDTPGTGVGLALCKRIIERYGGAIWIRSDGKKGTAFFFTVPAAGNDNNVAPGDVS